MGHLSRADAREQFRAALAARVAQADKDGWKDFVRDMEGRVH